MPYHVKSPGKLNTGDVYYKGGDTWTQVYADRKQFANISDANAQKAASITRSIGGTNYNYQLDVFKNATVVTE